MDNQAYPVTVDALHTVFSPYGYVQKIAIFDKNGSSQVIFGHALAHACTPCAAGLVRPSFPLRPQALVQYPDPGSAANAKAALEGHAIYDGGYNRVRPCASAPLLHRQKRSQAGLTPASRARRS